MPETVSIITEWPDNGWPDDGATLEHLGVRVELEYGSVLSITIPGRADHEVRVELFSGDLAVELHHEGTFARLDTGNIEEKQS